jgi:hypothetical protein
LAARVPDQLELAALAILRADVLHPVGRRRARVAHAADDVAHRVAEHAQVELQLRHRRPDQPGFEGAYGFGLDLRVAAEHRLLMLCCSENDGARNACP